MHGCPGWKNRGNKLPATVHRWPIFWKWNTSQQGQRTRLWEIVSTPTTSKLHETVEAYGLLR